MNAMYGMSIIADRQEVLTALRANRETHAQIVAEAREGYVAKAREALERRLGEIREGKVVALTFSLKPPQDHTRDYDTVIRMLEMHKDDIYALSAEQVRCFIEDRWDWTQEFLVGSAHYSKSANDRLNG